MLFYTFFLFQRRTKAYCDVSIDACCRELIDCINITPSTLAIRARCLRGQRLQYLWRADFFQPVTITNNLAYLEKFQGGCYTHGTYVPDKNLKRRKLEINFSCLFDQIYFSHGHCRRRAVSFRLRLTEE